MAELEQRTRLEEPVRIMFEWSLNEQGTRVSGSGVARIEPPFRARLDLFMNDGTTIARAALVNDDLRIPAGVPEGIIPPPHLLWTALGVFRPGSSAAFLGAQAGSDGDVRLRYTYADGRELRYRVADGRIQEAELLEGGRVIQRVALMPDEEGRYPDEATYRNLEAYRELRLAKRSVEGVEPYPPDIWFPIR